MKHPRRSNLVLCCVVDRREDFYKEFIIWSLCVNKYCKDENLTIKAYFIKGITEEMKTHCEKMEIHIKTSNIFIDGSPHCNKMIPLFDEENESYDGIVITDTDLYFVGKFQCYFKKNQIRLAPNNGNNPPLYIYQNIFEAFNIEKEIRTGISLMKGSDGSRESYINNNSGGIIMIPQKYFSKVRTSWRNWAIELIKSKELLGRWKVHVDQVAFALAMEELGEDIFFLPPQLNAVIKLLPNLNAITAFHITKAHRRNFKYWFDEKGLLIYPTKNILLLNAMKKLNHCIMESNDIKVKLTKSYLF